MTNIMDHHPAHHHEYLHPRRSEMMWLEKAKPNSIALADAYIQWAEVLKNQGDQEQAKAYFQKAISMFDNKSTQALRIVDLMFDPSDLQSTEDAVDETINA